MEPNMKLRKHHLNGQGEKNICTVASLNVQDPILFLGPNSYLAISPQQIVGGRALESKEKSLLGLPYN